LLRPGFELIMPPVNKVVHVLKELFPSHHSWSWIWWDESCALGAVWISADLFAHILTHIGELALHLGTILEVRSLA